MPGKRTGSPCKVPAFLERGDTLPAKTTASKTSKDRGGTEKEPEREADTAAQDQPSEHGERHGSGEQTAEHGAYAGAACVHRA